MRGWAAAAALVVLLAACGTDAAPDSSTSTGGPSTTVHSGTVSSVPGVDGVRVAVTGYVSSAEDGSMEVCPDDAGDCPGIKVVGEVPASDEDPRLLRLVGTYDGRTLVIERWEELAAAPFTGSDYANPCGISGSGIGNPSEAATVAVNGVVADHSDRFAGMWWDSSNQVMTMWFTGDDVDGLRADLASAAGDAMVVCVTGGATYSERELHDIQMSLDSIVDYRALAVSSASIDVLENRVEVAAEFLDAPTRVDLEEAHGRAVIVRAFIEVLDGSVSDLPPPVPTIAGNVDLLTQPNRAGGGMDALGRFELSFDPELACVFFPGDEDGGTGEPGSVGRILPVWPFGFTAVSGPLRIYDFDGTLVAQEGDTIEMGGGFVAVEYIDAVNTCGATGAWITSSMPVLVEP